ncbi:MAG: cupin domain-containing protein [Planctomycetota bacterium]|jgi:quercetin dioxygenase-like cupin family protein
MLVRRADEMEGTPVQIEGAEAVAMRVMVGRADGAPTFSMRHFTVEAGGHTPHHSHNYEHEVFVVEGAGRIEQDGDRRDLRPGDVVFVGPNVVHQFTNTGDGPFKFLCIVPVSYDCGTPTPGS